MHACLTRCCPSEAPLLESREWFGLPRNTPCFQAFPNGSPLATASAVPVELTTNRSRIWILIEVPFAIDKIKALMCGAHQMHEKQLL